MAAQGEASEAATGGVGLHRTVRRLGVLLITLSGITPAASVFIMGQQVIAQVGTGAFIAFVAAGLLGLTTAYVYAELSSAFPVTGGEYSIIGRTLGAPWGFMALGLNLVGGGLGQAVTALGLAAYLQVALPGLPVLPTALAATLGTTLVTVLNIRVNAVITGAFLLVELLAIGLLTSLGVLHTQRPMFELAVHPMMLGVGGALAPASFAAIGMATAGAIYAYNGYGGAVFFGEEMHEARSHLAWVVFWSLAIAVAAELAPITAVLVGARDLKAFLTADQPLPSFVAAAGGPWLAKAVSLGVAFAIVNAMIAIGLINARQLYCSARDGAWPGAANRALAAIHPRFNSPWIATLVMGALTAASCFLSLKLLVMLTANGLVMIYAGVSAAVIAGRRNGSTAQGEYRMPLFPLAPALSLIALAAVAVADLMDTDTGRPSLIANLAVMAAFAAYWAFYLRRRGGWALTGAGGEAL